MKSVFLINPISGRGHLDAYARLYARALVELGYRVVLVAESDADAPGYLARNAPGPRDLFSFIPFDQCVVSNSQVAVEPVEKPSDNAPAKPPDQPFAGEPKPDLQLILEPVLEAAICEPVVEGTIHEGQDTMPPLQRAQLVWQEEGPSGIFRRFIIVPRRKTRAIFPDSIRSRANLHFLRRARLVWSEEGLKGTLYRFIVVPRRVILPHIPRRFRKTSRLFATRVYRSLSRYRIVRDLRYFFYPESGRILFPTMLQYLKNVPQASEKRTPDLVIFLYLDLMAEGPSNLAALDAADSMPWVGILFHPRLAKTPHAVIEGYFKSKNARGGIFLVPSAIDIYSKAAPHLKFALVPDVADLEFAAEMPAIAGEIQARAKGRKIILQVGSIAAHKGIMTLLDVIASADRHRFFFALVGEVHWQSFGSHEKRLKAFYARPPENVYVHEGYLKEERDYNSLVKTCDVIYAVYHGFNSSSNSLTKAAGLQRPILVAKNTLMGDRVEASGIGLVVSEGNAPDILAALGKFASDSSVDFDFDRYVQEHSLEKLKSVLSVALPQWLGETADRAS